MEDIPQAPASSTEPMLCTQCHQPILPTYYFCPNCGKKLSEPALSTSTLAQIWLYTFSIVLPIICYLAIGYWAAPKYVKSADPKARMMGIVAIVLLLISTGVTFWLGIEWINQVVQSSISSVGNIGAF